MVLAMEYEGYTNLKPPCNTSDLINNESVVCFKGQPWVQEFALATWIDVPNKNITLIDNENFHNAATVYPFHHPEIDGSCSANIKTACTVFHISNSENAYNSFDEWKLSNSPISAYETKTKLKSRQMIYQQIGKTDANFDALDKVGNECKMLNEKVMSWALS